MLLLYEEGIYTLETTDPLFDCAVVYLLTEEIATTPPYPLVLIQHLEYQRWESDKHA